MLCCGSKTMNSHMERLISRYERKFRFTDVKLKFYIESFYRIGNSKSFTKEQFRENMGLLGLDSTCLISDRIFSVMCKPHSNQVHLGEYLEYMDILLYGSPEEKSEQSFKLITNSESDGITYEDFVEWLINVWKMYNSLTGYEISTSSEDIQVYFEKLDRNKDGIIDLQEYKEAMTENKNLYEWFEFAKRGIQEDVDEDVDMEMDKWAYEKSLNLIERDLNVCLEAIQEKRNSRRIAGASLTSRVNRVSVNVDDEDNADGEPRFNKGDMDLPEEFDMSDERVSVDYVQSCIFEILGKVKELKGGDVKMDEGRQHRSYSDSSVSFS